MFLLVYPVFLEVESKKYDLHRGWKVNCQKIKPVNSFQIHQINPFLFSISNTECTDETEVFVYSVFSMSIFILT